jgi:hypothetical protein
MKVKTIIEHTMASGHFYRMCNRCWLHVDSNGDIDQDYYTARQYFAFMAHPIECRCRHEFERPDTREELLKKIDASCRLNSELSAILKDIVQAMKI